MGEWADELNEIRVSKTNTKTCSRIEDACYEERDTRNANPDVDD